MANTETNLNQLVINDITQEKYNELKSAGTLKDNELYFVDDTENYLWSTTSSFSNEVIIGLTLSYNENTFTKQYHFVYTTQWNDVKDSFYDGTTWQNFTIHINSSIALDNSFNTSLISITDNTNITISDISYIYGR